MLRIQALPALITADLECTKKAFVHYQTAAFHLVNSCGSAGMRIIDLNQYFLQFCDEAFGD